MKYNVILIFVFILYIILGANYITSFENIVFSQYINLFEYKEKNSIDVRTLGAKSLKGFDNTKIFQYCLDNYKEVYIPAGVYEYSNIIIGKPGVRLYGDGKGKTILSSTKTTKVNQHAAPNIRILNDNCILENLTSTYKFLPNYKLNANGRNPINEDANISIGWSEAYSPSKSYLVRDITVQNCEVVGSVVQGIAIGVSKGVKILNNSISETRGAGIFGYYADEISIIGNMVSKTGDDGIYISANGDTKYSPHGRITNVLIQDNEIRNSSAKGIGLSGCEFGEISFNKIVSTFADGILVSKDNYYGHVSAKNVKIHHNTLTNIFGEFGAESKHQNSANEKLGGFYGMIAIITDNVYSNYNTYAVYSNTSTSDKRLIGKYGYYGSYIFGYNVIVFDNKFFNGNFGIMIGNPSSLGKNESGSIILRNNEFGGFKRNVVLIKVTDVSVEDNLFGDADWCITEEQVDDIIIKNNSFDYERKFFLNQTGSKILKINNHFKK